ncbi:hypothetical protein LW138_05670 [Helicobacter sp. faydin-H17]|uniref:hypothetical protein n=1 Tax=Helicobacter kayseriensis TaxID=2905877 RepID=UPI001E629B69|nr:hypothetical protein [Helicobacter kayseriensis]MCE3047569.1 hypothetical protein [Helicobacter kayseriensis]
MIISQLKSAHSWSKLKEFDEISKLINSLTLEARKYIAFAHKKEQILLVALKNPNLCAEFNTYTAPILLNTLSSFKEHFPTLSSLKQIKAYFPQTPSPPKRSTSLLSKEELDAQLKQIKSYRQRRALIQKYQEQGCIRFLPPRHFARYNEIIETFFIQAYQERSDGNFQIQSTNPKLTSIFESIQHIIQQSHES